jgi:hypothetical protein
MFGWKETKGVLTHGKPPVRLSQNMSPSRAALQAISSMGKKPFVQTVRRPLGYSNV